MTPNGVFVYTGGVIVQAIQKKSKLFDNYVLSLDPFRFEEECYGSVEEE